MFTKQGFRRYFTNTLWLMIEKAMLLVMSLLVGAYVARYLGPNRYGLFNYVLSFVGLFAIIATLGLDSIIVREIVKNPKIEKEYLGTAFVLKLVGSLVLFVVIAISTNFVDDDYFTRILIYILAAGTIFQSFSVIDFYFQAKVQSKYVVFINSFQVIISSLLKIYLIAIKSSLIWFIIVVFFESVLTASGLAFVYFKNNRSLFSWRFEFKLARSLLKDSWPLLFSGLFILIYLKIDQIMIQKMLNSEALGYYAAAARISEVWYFIPMAIAGSLFPAIVNSKNDNNQLYNNRIQGLFVLMTWTSLIIAVFITIFAKPIILILFGNRFIQSVAVLKIHVWSGIFVFLGVASGKWLIVENMQMFALYKNIAGAVINIILNIIFIPSFGIKAAALTTLFAHFVSSFLCYAFTKKTRKIFIMQLKSFIWPFQYINQRIASHV